MRPAVLAYLRRRRLWWHVLAIMRPGRLASADRPFGGLEPGSDVRERQAALVLHLPWSQGRIARRKPGRRCWLGVGSGITWSLGGVMTLSTSYWPADFSQPVVDLTVGDALRGAAAQA